MGLSIAIAGAVIIMAVLFSMPALYSVVEQIFSGSITSSEINEVEDSISKTDFKIRTVDACSGRDPRIVKVGLSNTGNEKLSNFDDFDVFATYDADIAGVKTRVTEQFTYNGIAFSVSQGQPISTKEIPHDYVEVVSRHQTNNGAYNDLPGALLSNDNFERGKDYLIYVTAQVNGNDAGQVYGIQTVHGATVFSGSEFRIEPRAGNVYHTYAWFTVWSPATLGDSVDDIKLQYKRHTGGGGDIGRFDQVTMFTMELTDNVGDNVYWLFDDDETANQPLTTAWSLLNNAEITFTPDCSNDTWLVMATAQIDSTQDGDRRYETRLQADGGVTIDVDNVSKEGEDGGDTDLYTETIVTTYNIPSVATTFTSQSQSEGGNAGEREYSAVFALNLDKLKYQNSDSFTFKKDVGTVPDWLTEVQTLDFTPEEAGDVWILGYFISDSVGNSQEGYHVRMQVYEKGEIQEDQPPTQTQDLYIQNRQWDNAGQHEWSIQTVENFDATSYTVDIDADAETNDNRVDAIYRTLSFASMIAKECTGGTSGVNLEVGEWTINCIKNDNLDPDIINKNEDAEILLKLEHQIFPDGLLEVSIATKNGETQVRSVLIP